MIGYHRRVRVLRSLAIASSCLIACGSSGDDDTDGDALVDVAPEGDAVSDASDTTSPSDARDAPSCETPAFDAFPGPFLAGVWTLPSLARVGLNDPPDTSTSAVLHAARGEVESFQIVVHGPAGGASSLQLFASELDDGCGHVLPPSTFTLYREHYVAITPSPLPGPIPAGMVPDALIPFTDPDTGAPLSGARFDAIPYDVPAGENAPFWVDVSVPRDATPGTYFGVVHVTSDHGGVDVPVTLTVWKFALPNQPSLKSAFLVWNETSLPTYRTLLRHRLSPSSVPPSDERTLIDTLGLNATNLGFWSGADNTCHISATTPTTSSITAAMATHEKDLFRYAYTFDEVDACLGDATFASTFFQWAKNLHAAGAKNLVTTTPNPALYDDGTGRSAVDVWVVLPKMYEAGATHVAEVLAKGNEVWSYNTLTQDDHSPKWELDYEPIGFRIFTGFIDATLGLSGVLYWRVDLWSADPWTDVGYHEGGGVWPGEALLVYPGKDVGTTAPAPSMRLKWLRDGVDDFEYVAALRAAGKGDWALSRTKTVAPDWRSWTRDTAALEAVRRELGDALGGP